MKLRDSRLVKDKKKEIVRKEIIRKLPLNLLQSKDFNEICEWLRENGDVDYSNYRSKNARTRHWRTL